MNVPCQIKMRGVLMLTSISFLMFLQELALNARFLTGEGQIMEVIWRNWYCQECFLQFDSKSVFDLHLSLVHGEKVEIKKRTKIVRSINRQA